MEKYEISEILELMKKVYQGRQIDTSPEAIETWSIMLDGYTKQDVIGALKRLVKQSKYVPSVHEVLKNIEESFRVEMMQRRDVLVIRVVYKDQIIPFKFTDKSAANEVIQYLKRYPSKEDIMLLHEKNLHDNNPFVRALFVDQSGRKEFDDRQKSKYYVQRTRKGY